MRRLLWLVLAVVSCLDFESSVIAERTLRRISRSQLRMSAGMKRSVKCPNSEYVPPRANHCCNKCTRGYYIKSYCNGSSSRTVCERCPNGTFLAYENSLTKCKSCKVCDPELNQVEQRGCDSSNDRTCGCGPNTFKKWIDSTTFSCEPCRTCQTETLQPCSELRDTVCSCQLKFFYDPLSKDCHPCESCQGGFQCNQCSHLTEASSSLHRYLSIISSTVVGITLAGALGYLAYRKAKNCSSIQKRSIKSSPRYVPDVKGTIPEDTSPPERLLPIQEEGQSPPSMLLAPPRITELPDCVQGAGSSPLPDNHQVNYTIADVVPTSRWREFVRRLGLPDAQIERAEMDSRCSYREAQYQMIQLWRQQHGTQRATLEEVYRALRDMHLNGCAEQLQERLQ